MSSPVPILIPAEPFDFPLVPERCALVIIDMQRDFLEPGGFGAMRAVASRARVFASAIAQ